jgi:hypothetical protein
VPWARQPTRSPDGGGSEGIAPAPTVGTLDYAHQPTLGGAIVHDLAGGGVAIRVLPSRSRKVRAAVQQVVLVCSAILIPFSLIYTQWNDWMRHGPPLWGIITLVLLSGVGLVWSSIIFANTFFPVFIQASSEGLATTSGRGPFARNRGWRAREIEDVYMARLPASEGAGAQVQLRTRGGYVHPLVDASPDEATYIAQRLREALTLHPGAMR